MDPQTTVELRYDEHGTPGPNVLPQLGWQIVLVMLAFAASAIGGLCVIMITSPLAAIDSSWIGEALTGFVAAAVWMAVGMRIAPPHAAVSAALFLVGMACAWFLSRGVVHSVSPYYGLVSVASACAGGALAWAIMDRMRRHATPVLAIAFPAVALVVGAAIILATPALAVTRPLWNGDREPIRVHMITVDRGGNHAVYLWTMTPASIAPSEPVRVELDPGSGAGSYRLVPVRGAAEIEQLCDGFRRKTREMIDGEVDGGSVPRFVTRIPFKLARCEEGALWEVTPVQAPAGAGTR